MRVLAAAAERARGGQRVWDLTAGQPSTPAPAPVRAAAHRHLDENVLGYTATAGIPELREAIAGHYRLWYGLDVDPARVFVTTGSSGGFLLAFLAAFDPGARVAMATPGYPAYRNILQALGCQVVELPCGARTRYQPTVEMLDGLELDGLVLASPANPTGTVLPADELSALVGYCATAGIRLVSDEIYHGISYGRRASSAWEFSPDPAADAVVVNSFSKYFSMTGWRIGWLLLPPDLLDPVDRLAGNLAICPPVLAQHAAVHAFEAYRECDAHVARYQSNRDLLLAGLADCGLTDVAPADGAFYVYADVSHVTEDSPGFCRRLLDVAGVAIAPGIDFDPARGHRSIRVSFAGSAATIAGGVDALRTFLTSGS